MNATDAVRSGEPTGRLASGSRNEKTNRYGPFSCWPMITGITDGPDAPADDAGPDPDDAAGAVDQPGLAPPPEPQAAAASATSASAAGRAARIGTGRPAGMDRIAESVA